MLNAHGLSKAYGSFLALDDVSFEVPRNRVVGIVGENGAGKSTLFNLISGIAAPDRGHVELDGRIIRPRSYREANQLGISRVFQEQALIPNIAVYENILLSHEARFCRFGQILDRRRMVAVARRIVEAFGLDIDVERETGSYDFSIRQAIEIARACLVPQEVLGIESPVVLLDEPTSALARTEEEALFRLIRSIRDHGTVLFVSHRLSEVIAACDVIYVLKDGRLVAQADPEVTTEATLHELMVGRERDADYYHEQEQVDAAARPARLRCRQLSLTGAYDEVDLDVREGEVLGIGGLLDSGKSSLGKGIAGLIASERGDVQIGDAAPAAPVFQDLIAQGVAYVPAERLVEGIIAAFPVAWNVSLAGGADLFASALGYWRAKLEASVTRSSIEALAIKSATPRTPCSALSGGNQQKVALAKWLCRSPRVLILDNPTRGIDAGAKEEVYRLLRGLAAQGVAVILISDELLELIGLSNRIAIMRAGRVVSVVDAPPGAKPTERHIVSLMLQ
jgi:ribose transport system ATP-binding protein